MAALPCPTRARAQAVVTPRKSSGLSVQPSRASNASSTGDGSGARHGSLPRGLARGDIQGIALDALLYKLYPRTYVQLVPVACHKHVDELIFSWDAKMVQLANTVDMKRAACERLAKAEAKAAGKGNAGGVPQAVAAPLEKAGSDSSSNGAAGDGGGGGALHRHVQNARGVAHQGKAALQEAAAAAMRKLSVEEAPSKASKATAKLQVRPGAVRLLQEEQQRGRVAASQLLCYLLQNYSAGWGGMGRPPRPSSDPVMGGLALKPSQPAYSAHAPLPSAV